MSTIENAEHTVEELAASARSDRHSQATLRRRLRPLYLAALLQGFILWVPVEKLFMSEIGFDARSIGIMAERCRPGG